MPPRIFAVWCMSCLFWSSTFLFVRLGVTAVPPLTFAWTRLALALAILGPVALARGWFTGLTRRDVALIGGTGLLILGVNYALLYWRAQFIPSGLVAILQSATPLIALAIGWMLGSEQVNGRKVAAFAASMLGVVVIFSDDAAIPRGIALVAERSPATAQWPRAAIVSLLYLAIVGSVVAFRVNYWLLLRIDASLMLLMGVAEVPIAVALGAIVLNEDLHARALAGAAFIAAGVALVAIPRSVTFRS